VTCDLIIDLFAGGGGASEAILRTYGRHPDIAVNHDKEAIALHEANHPSTLHLCDDIRQVDVAAVLARPEFRGRRVGLLWASPDCKDHSKAKGGRPKDKNIRGLAWEVLRWSAAIKRATGSLPRQVALENVEEFADWGPIHAKGPNAGRVMKHRRGETFRLWKEQLRSIGFHAIEHRELVAADYGAPTTRKRLFLIARSDGQAIAWPKPTHAPKSKVTKQGDLFSAASAHALTPYRSAASFIDWNRPIPSIFGRRRALQPKTQARIAKGIKRYVIEAARPFIVKVTHTTGTDAASAADDPLQTVTTAKGGEFAVSAPTIMPLTHGGAIDRSYDPQEPIRTITAAHRGELSVVAPALVPRYGERPGQEPRARSVEDPYPTVVPDGNGGQLVAANVIRTDMQSAALRNGVHSAEDPLRTITTSGGFAAAAVHLTKFSENSIGTKPDEPLHPAMAGAPGHGVVAAYLGRQFGTTVSGRDLAEPHPAVMSDGGGGKSQLVSAHLSRMAKGSVGSAADEPVLTSATHAKDALIAPVIDKYYGSGVAADPAEPLDTATAKARFGLGAAFLEQANTGLVGHSVEDALSTIVGSGSHQRLIDAHLGDESAPHRRQVLEFLWRHFGAPTEAECADPLATALGRLRFGLVVIDDVCWSIVDVGMRMLTPRELYSAQGFGPEYQIEITFAGKPLTKTAQTRMAGNSVSPPPAAALLKANMIGALQIVERVS
jgi:DNA (cytosine-5)-methyltransferase 1